MHQYLNKRVLVTIGDNDAVRQSSVTAISPNGKYVLLDSDWRADEAIGWTRVEAVSVLDVIGEIE